MYRAYAVRYPGERNLLNPGGDFDRNFALPSSAVFQYEPGAHTSSAGRFRSNQLLNKFRSNGLIDSSFGPPLKHFPFYEDARPILDAIRAFLETFVGAYYEGD